MTENLSRRQPDKKMLDENKIGLITFDEASLNTVKQAFDLSERYLHPRALELVGDMVGSQESAQDFAQTIAMFLADRFPDVEDIDILAFPRSSGGFFVMVHAESGGISQGIDDCLDDFIVKFSVSAIKQSK